MDVARPCEGVDACSYSASVGRRHHAAAGLSPPLLTINHAEAASTTSPAGADATIRFDPADAAAFDRIASANFGKQIAIVMFAHVLVAPTVTATHYNEVASVSGVDAQTVANMVASLNG